MQDLKNTIKNKKYKVVSFDIFDTLLLRPYVKPTDLFLHIEKLQNKYGFANERITAEQKARDKNRDKEDVTIYEIYQEIDSKYSNMLDIEINLEKQVLTVHKQIKEIYDIAIQYAEKVIIVSDMYLTQDILQDILNEKGYNNYHKLYVSSEIKLTKNTGNLFKYILNDLSIDAKDVLHIGDNYHSDYKMANSIAIEGFYI